MKFIENCNISKTDIKGSDSIFEANNEQENNLEEFSESEFKSIYA